MSIAAGLNESGSILAPNRGVTRGQGKFGMSKQPSTRKMLSLVRNQTKDVGGES